MNGLDLRVLALVSQTLRARNEGLGVRRVPVQVDGLLRGHASAKVSMQRPMPADVTIYTTRICGYCFAAKRLLGARGIPYEEIDVTGNDEKRAWLVQATGRRKVPQIFIGSEAIVGGVEGEIGGLSDALS